MDGWVGGWMDGWMDGWVDGWIDRQTDTHTHTHRMQKPAKIRLWLNIDKQRRYFESGKFLKRTNTGQIR